METINNIVNNQCGITEKQIKTIANNELKPYILINECKKQKINIVNENQINKDKQGNIINVKPKETENKRNPFKTMLNIFNRRYNNDKAKYNNDVSKFLKENETDFKTMCKKQEVNYNKFKDHVLKNVE